ncbi:MULTISPECIES: pantoate--beta-alanine ligase [Bradyrhizobium]|uniref:Pantothenate synthetase n=2 Tax=Bradyrhizobium TaxID=374 RepID=A0A410VI23_9BRAD|nr:MULTISPECIES: pantoate--beta-alanine ligase [Bradyrhizobium]MCG2632618.1 pantoate--beta-alanine ligase [Bradyrhizobium zhengyangense]MCG2645379.1 pantoate--beta-alanine ligase [Bradyrhizobium zhengyangense]MCG2672851.1 pantoate--beta-alanine ligase [Bradyrhizobium zhengyangense]MDN4985697.1 pantoate--beta-alanine ligase [Bradyrhizobium sp. WYCCWR 13022]MDT4740898.1 pantoate--beta-alanine ligase [Bradyrhizobium sp. WYCCWR 12699]
MRTIKTVRELRRALAGHKPNGRVGFVPTMGYLHDGHLALVKASRARCNTTVVSIFVNPAQFGPKEDLSVYPRDFPRDERLCREADVDIIFAPGAEEVYRSGFDTFVEPGAPAQPLCGPFRPGHFRGVTTVVCKLFNMVQPDLAFFGQKDFQQCAVVRRMVTDLNLPIEIVTVPTVRDPDGLAMSSRNRYLSAPERSSALSISRGLFAAKAVFQAGERDSIRLLSLARQTIEIDELQYLEIVDAETLTPATSELTRPAAICVAGYVGSTRLIDNILLDTTEARRLTAR